MDIIITEHSGPIVQGPHGRRYNSDNILSVWVREEGKEKPRVYFLICIYKMPVGRLEMPRGSLCG